MPTPAAAPTSSRRLVLVPAARRSGTTDGSLRRYRLARVEPDSRDRSREQRFEHLKRTFD